MRCWLDDCGDGGGGVGVMIVVVNVAVVVYAGGCCGGGCGVGVMIVVVVVVGTANNMFANVLSLLHEIRENLNLANFNRTLIDRQ